MQLSEQITVQNFALNPILAKQFLVSKLKGFLSDNPQENEQKLEDLVKTLFSIQPIGIRVTFAELICNIDHFPLELIESHLKTQLLKNLSQFSANEIVLLCESFTDFNKCIYEISGNQNKLTLMVLLFALQFPAEYINIIIEIKKLLAHKNKDVSLEIIRILSSFLPRTLKLIFSPNARLSVTLKGHKKTTLSFSEFIAELANGKKWALTFEKLTRIFTQPIFLNLLSNHTITYDELHKLTIPIIEIINYLSEKGIEINKKLVELILSPKCLLNTHKIIKQSLILALSPTYNYQFNTDSCYLFILITLSLQSTHQNSVNGDVSFTMKFLRIFGVEILSKISDQIVNPLHFIGKNTLLDLLIYQIKKISSVTDDFLNEIKQLLEKFITAKTITLAELQESITKKINEHLEIIAEQKKAIEKPTYVAPANASAVVKMVGAQNIAYPNTPRLKSALQLASASAKPAAPANATPDLEASDTETLKKQKLAKLRALLLSAPNSSLFDLRNIQFNEGELDSLLEEANHLLSFLIMRKFASSNQPVVPIAKPAAIPTPAAALATLGLHCKRQLDENKLSEEDGSEVSTNEDKDNQLKEQNSFTKYRKEK